MNHFANQKIKFSTPTTGAALLRLIRWDKPIGSLLLLWPTWIALTLAGRDATHFPWPVWCLFSLGVLLTRSLGCIWNDWADRHVDGHVTRTAKRPLATGELSTKQALCFFVLLSAMAFAVVMFTNRMTVLLAFAAMGWILLYPFSKRFTYFPQVILGLTFGWCVPMSYAALQQALPAECWLLYLATAAWVVGYDTQYAITDRDDDVRVGIRSTARWATGFESRFLITCFSLAWLGFGWLGVRLDLGGIFWSGLLGSASVIVWGVYQTHKGGREDAFRAFRQHHWVGLLLWLAFALELAREATI